MQFFWNSFFSYDFIKLINRNFIVVFFNNICKREITIKQLLTSCINKYIMIVQSFNYKDHVGLLNSTIWFIEFNNFNDLNFQLLLIPMIIWATLTGMTIWRLWLLIEFNNFNDLNFQLL